MLTRLKEARKSKGLTQEQLAEMLGFQQVTLSAWESGKREPNFETLIKIADICECSIDWLLCRTEIHDIGTKKSTPEELAHDVAVAESVLSDQNNKLPIEEVSPAVRELIRLEIQKALEESQSVRRQSE